MQKYLVLSFVILISCLGAKAANKMPSGWSVSSKTPSSKSDLRVALIDMDLVYKSSQRILEAYQAMGEKEQSVRRLLMTAESELRALQEQDSPSLDTKKAEIQALIDQKVQSLYKEKDQYTAAINADLEAVMTKLAKQGKYDLILDKAYSFQTAKTKDLSQQFIAEFDAKASKN